MAPGVAPAYLGAAMETSMSKPVSPGEAAGVSEAMIGDLVRAFYGRVRRDPVLGPVFEAVIGDGWDAHLAKLCDFWSSVVLRTGRFEGSPMAAHAKLPDIGPAHFARWLDLFAATAADICPPAAAALFKARAEMIAQSLQLGLAVSRGELPPLR
jgi:hemoglobin